ncbi:dethiobiotin synthase [Thiococcus pfennigii]|uniref:dethiobiotin synthase n=1 Tax=Thiococcus pfennigii TaxID=1057 RepID=UPI001908893C|nr:dethiobiotin synthase [Thiococcus pfennigii]
MSGLFVTGTDTDCGKTEIALGLMAAWQGEGRVVLGMKPVASGCRVTPAGLRNADAERLLAQGSRAVDYRLVNPYAFAPPMAPHVAAAQAACEIDLEVIAAAYAELAAAAERVVVEGVGGWRVPLGGGRFVGDLPRRLDLPVVLVVGLRLGCLNHALLTAETIAAEGARLIGWVANRVDPAMAAAEESLATLEALIAAPCLGVVPRLGAPTPARCAAHLDLGVVARH